MANKWDAPVYKQPAPGVDPMAAFLSDMGGQIIKDAAAKEREQLRRSQQLEDRASSQAREDEIWEKNKTYKQEVLEEQRDFDAILREEQRGDASMAASAKRVNELQDAQTKAINERKLQELKNLGRQQWQTKDIVDALALEVDPSAPQEQQDTVMMVKQFAVEQAKKLGLPLTGGKPKSFKNLFKGEAPSALEEAAAKPSSKTPPKPSTKITTEDIKQGAASALDTAAGKYSRGASEAGSILSNIFKGKSPTEQRKVFKEEVAYLSSRLAGDKLNLSMEEAENIEDELLDLTGEGWLSFAPSAKQMEASTRKQALGLLKKVQNYLRLKKRYSY